MALQGLASFPGISIIIGAELTLSHGISPSVGTIRTVPHTNFIAGIGDLVFTFGTKTIRFKDCALDRASLTVNSNGQEWSINVMDRRWRWQNENGGGCISGHWNQRTPSGAIDEDYEKTPQELAKLLLEAMGETKFDVTALPDKPRPEVRWDYDTPAQMLAELCDQLVCRISLGLDDKIYIHPIGKGKQLPTGGEVCSGGFGFDTSVVPSSMKVVGGPKRFQNRFRLAPVGIDTDGSVKDLEKLSYRPLGTTGFSQSEPGFFNNITATYQKEGVTYYSRDLARQSVWKMFRLKNIVGEAVGNFTPRNVNFQVKDVNDILPLGDGLIDSETMPDGTKKPKPYEVIGEWYGFNEDGSAVDRGDKYKGSFSVDTERGLVIFSNPVFKIKDDGTIEEPELYLLTSHGVKEDGLPIRYELERKIPGAKGKTKARILRHDEIDNTEIQRYGPTFEIRDKVEANSEDVKKEAEHWLDAAEKEYQIEQSVSYEYAGLLSIQLDGAIQQVTWSVGDGQAATTRASRNQENDIYTPSYKERRRVEKQAALEKAAKDVGDKLAKAARSAAKFLGISS